MKRAPSSNDNIPSTWNKSGYWLMCACGFHLYGIRRDERTGLHHLICDNCGEDNTMSAFG